MDLHLLIAWGIFLAAVLGMLAIDLFVLHRQPHEIRVREAAIGSIIPIIGALLCCGAIYFAYQHHFLDLGIVPVHLQNSTAAHFYPSNGGEAALTFLTGYLVELSLSADNVFLFAVLMTFFKVPRNLQHRVLFWGVLGALVMRGVMIVAGAALLSQFEWIIYIFGAFLIYTAIRMFITREEEGDPSKNIAVRISQKLLPIHPGFHGKHFFIIKDGKRLATTLFVVLICIEITDLIFALDSIPAIFGITRDPFIVFTSNVFAILGLRSMYFLLAGIMDKFHYLKYGLAAVLGFVGVKMLLPGLGYLYGQIAGGTHHWDIDKFLSLGIIVTTLTLSILASVFIPRKTAPGAAPTSA